MVTKIIIVLLLIIVSIFVYYRFIYYIDLKEKNVKSNMPKRIVSDLDSPYIYRNKKCELQDDFFFLHLYNLEDNIEFKFKGRTFTNGLDSQILILNFNEKLSIEVLQDDVKIGEIGQISKTNSLCKIVSPETDTSNEGNDISLVGFSGEKCESCLLSLKILLYDGKQEVAVINNIGRYQDGIRVYLNVEDP